MINKLDVLSYLSNWETDGRKFKKRGIISKNFCSNLSYRKNSPRDPHVYRVPSMSHATGGYNSNSGWKKKIIHNEIDKYTFEQTSNFCIDLLTSSINSSKKRKMKRITFFFYQTRKTPKWREHCRGNVRRRPSTSPEHLPNSIVRLSSKRILDIWSHEMDCTETYSNDTK